MPCPAAAAQQTPSRPVDGVLQRLLLQNGDLQQRCRTLAFGPKLVRPPFHVEAHGRCARSGGHKIFQPRIPVYEAEADLRQICADGLCAALQQLRGRVRLSFELRQ